MPPVYRPELRAGPYGAKGHNRRRRAATPSLRLVQAALKALESALPLATRAGSDSPARSIGWTTSAEQAKVNVGPPTLDTPPGRRRAHFAPARRLSLVAETALAPQTSLPRRLMPASHAPTPPLTPPRPASACAASRPCCSSP